jgi:hypothetical protein
MQCLVAILFTRGEGYFTNGQIVLRLGFTSTDCHNTHGQDVVIDELQSRAKLSIVVEEIWETSLVLIPIGDWMEQSISPAVADFAFNDSSIFFMLTEGWLFS